MERSCDYPGGLPATGHRGGPGGRTRQAPLVRGRRRRRELDAGHAAGRTQPGRHLLSEQRLHWSDRRRLPLGLRSPGGRWPGVRGRRRLPLRRDTRRALGEPAEERAGTALPEHRLPGRLGHRRRPLLALPEQQPRLDRRAPHPDPDAERLPGLPTRGHRVHALSRRRRACPAPR